MWLIENNFEIDWEGKCNWKDEDCVSIIRKLLFVVGINIRNNDLWERKWM